MPDALAVEADASWGESCLGYSVLIHLTDGDPPTSAALRDRFAALHTALSALHLLPAWRATPLSTLHVSLFAFLHVGFRHPEKQALWERVRPLCEAEVRERCSRAPPFSLTFNRLCVTPRAIIAIADEAPPPIRELRASLRVRLAPFGFPALRYDIVHTTLARFSEDGQLTASQVAAVERVPVSIACEVSEMRIVRERVYPSLVLDELARFPLRGADD